MSERMPCPIKGCDHTRQPEHAFCVMHWRAVPYELRKSVISAWQDRRRAKSRLDAAVAIARRAGEQVPSDDPRRAAMVQAMRAHLQALEDAQAVVETRAPRDLFAGLTG